MKFDFDIYEVLGEEEIQGQLKKIFQGGTFSEKAENLGLDPECDFRASNLRNSDLSFSDLRGYNLTGSDLSGCFGIDVLIDDTTILDGADVEGSIFYAECRRRDLFRRLPQSDRLYGVLKDGDPYDVCSWMSGDGSLLPSKLVQGVSKEDASILCQKLLVDDIDLTKRTTIFYNLSNLTDSKATLRSVVADFVAFHIDDPNVLRGFLRAAGGLFSSDTVISKIILQLCRHRDASVREIAFIEIVRFKMFFQNHAELRELFFHAENEAVRSRILFETATKLSRFHARAIAAESRGNLDVSTIASYDDFLTRENIIEFLAADGAEVKKELIKTIRESREEILASAPVFRRFLALDDPAWLEWAKRRITIRSEDVERALATKILLTYRTGR